MSNKTNVSIKCQRKCKGLVSTAAILALRHKKSDSAVVTPDEPVPMVSEEDVNETDDFVALLNEMNELPSSFENKLCEVGTTSSEQGLGLVSGFVASKSKDLTLQRDNCDPVNLPVYCSYIAKMTKGGLTFPSESWYNDAKKMEMLFCVHHPKNDLLRTAGIVKSLTDIYVQKFPQRHRKDLQRFALTRTMIRLRKIREKMKEDRATLRSLQKKAQFVHANKGNVEVCCIQRTT